jgi:hypothetical protein
VGWYLLAHIGLPLGFGVAFVIFSAATGPSREDWDVLADAAQDLTILSLGATGAVFDNPRVEQAFGSNSVQLALAMVAVNLILSATVVLARARVARRYAHFTFWSAIIVLFLGALSLSVTAGTLVWAYSHGRP